MTTARYRAAHQAGFSAVEVAHPYNEDIEALARVLKETGLKQVIRIPTCLFLAPTGALEMLIFVCLSVCPVKSCLEQSIFIYLGQRALRVHSDHSESTKGR